MASSKLMSSSSSRSRNSDLSRRPSSSFSPATKPRAKPTTTAHPSSSSAHPQSLNNYQNTITNTTPALPIDSMTVDGLLYDSNPTPMTDATLLNAQIALLDSSAEINSSTAPLQPPKTVDEVWREIVSGECRKECKEEVPDDMMTLEDFLARAGAVEENDIKDFPLAPPPPETERMSSGVFSFDQIPLSPFGSIDKVEGSIVGFGNGADPAGSGGGGVGRRKRGRAVMEPMDKAAQQRQRRMIKNRESAARSRERKQAYQVELESLAVRLEEENEQLLKEQAEQTQARLKQLMENIIPVVEKRRPPRVLRRVRSLQW